MKTNVFVTFASILLVIVYLIVMRIDTDEGYGNMAQFIPDTALLYFEQHDGSEALERFAASPLGKHFEALDLVATGEKIGLAAASLAAIEELVSSYKKVKENTFVHQLLGKHFALAVLPPAPSYKVSTAKNFFMLNSVVVTRPRQDTGFLEFLAENYSRYSDELSISTVQYGNHRIRRVEREGLVVSVVAIDGNFLISRNERQLRRCIDTYDKDTAAVADNSNFLGVRKNFDHPDRYLYLPVNLLRHFFSEIVKIHVVAGKEFLLKELDTTIGFNGFGYGTWNRAESVVDKVVVTYNVREVNSHVQTYLNIDPVRSSMLSLSTPEPMVYYWSNTLDFKNFLLYADDEKTSDPRVVKFIDAIEKTSGRSAEEILSYLGKEVSLVLEPGPRQNYFPFPLGLVFVTVDKKKKLENLVRMLLQKYDVPVVEKTHGNARYVYWKLSPQDGLQPLYGFWKNIFFFGNSSKLLHKIVDFSAQKHSLQNIAAVQSIDPGIAEKNNSITYFNNVELIGVVQGALAMAGTLVGLEDKVTANNIRIVRDEVFNPLLKGLTMYDRSITRSYFSRNKVVVDSITHVNNY